MDLLYVVSTVREPVWWPVKCIILPYKSNNYRSKCIIAWYDTKKGVSQFFILLLLLEYFRHLHCCNLICGRVSTLPHKFAVALYCADLSQH